MSTPLTAYLDAVSEALTGFGVRVDLDAADEDARTLAIDLAHVSAVRRPVMQWTPDTGWRIGMLCRGRLRPATVRYLAGGPVPYPSQVAAAYLLWLRNPDGLTAVQPAYDTQPRLLDLALDHAAGGGQ